MCTLYCNKIVMYVIQMNFYSRNLYFKQTIISNIFCYLVFFLIVAKLLFMTAYLNLVNLLKSHKVTHKVALWNFAKFFVYYSFPFIFYKYSIIGVMFMQMMHKLFFPKLESRICNIFSWMVSQKIEHYFML